MPGGQRRAPAAALRLRVPAGRRPAHRAERLPDARPRRPPDRGDDRAARRRDRATTTRSPSSSATRRRITSPTTSRGPRAQAMTGALVLGALATLGNASDDVISDMMDLGASLGGRAYSQSYELEADRLGAFIAARAGYDPERGARVFARPALAERRRAALDPSRPRRSARPPSPATPPRSAASRRRACVPTRAWRPRALPYGADEDAAASRPRRKSLRGCVFGSCGAARPPLDTPSPQRTGSSRTSGAAGNRAARGLLRPAGTHGSVVARLLFELIMR